jgi:hypothetical protein
MITTTVRFDRDSWARLCLHSERLEIAKAAFIRDATIIHLARMEIEEGVLREHVTDTIATFATRLDHVEQWIRRGGGR